jgi:fatty-acyl-CoA synthase
MLYGQMQDSPLLISSLLEHAAQAHRDTQIVSRRSDGSIHRYDYRQLHQRAQQLAAALTALGVQVGERIGTLAWNTHRHFELYYGVSGMGAVLHTVNPRLFPDQLEYIINHAEDRILFFDLSFLPLVQKLRPQLLHVTRFVALGSPAEVAAVATDFPGLLCYEELLAAQLPGFVWPQLDERCASSLCYTSGTTGNPKGVLYSHRSTVLHSFAICGADSLALSSRDSALVIVPLFHANAWGIPYAAAMCGAKLVLPGAALDGESLCQLLTAERCSLSLGVPTVWLNFLSYLDRNPGQRPTSLKRVLIGGSAAPAAMIDRFEQELGIRVHHLWGMTETSPVGTCDSPPNHLADRSPSELRPLKRKQGRAIYGVQLKITDDQGSQLPHDGQAFGELMVRGPWVVRRYFKDEGGEILDRDGYFATGDVATIDSDGYMQITDRAKDVIKSGGEWISSIELESAAMLHPTVQQAAVIGLPHPLWVERPLLLVVRRPDSTATAAELREFLSSRVARWWLPDAIEFVAELPHTATGKVSKLTLRQRYRDYRLPDIASRSGAAAPEPR